jgi:subtilisin family serine protease
MALSRILAGVLFLSLSFAGCTKDRPVSEKPGESSDIFSNRPIADVADLYLVTLKNPPLVKSATKSADGHLQIDAQAKQAVLDEQAAFIQEVKSLSSTAEVIFTYKLVLNAVTLYATSDQVPEVSKLPQVKSISHVRRMGRPQTFTSPLVPGAKKTVTSASFIGAEEAHKLGFTGRGRRVGVLDTGVDFTHAMLGGHGDAAEYAAIDPALPTPLFPNAKIVGGMDLVGSDFDAASNLPGKNRPVPDANPIDESGHGSHVAGTIAGDGIGGDSYDGIAPDAHIYAIKVFGKEGSTLDAVIIRGLEYAMDPNGDLNPDDALDAVNLSLGGGYGPPQILYTEAIRNVTDAGVLVVASAGNSGPDDYIVGAPSTADDALSTAASIDGSERNWRFPGVVFSTAANPDMLVKAISGEITKSLDEIGQVEGDLVDLGFADVDLTQEQKDAVNGKIAFISRGKVSFADKITRAVEAGAIGVVMYNNSAGQPIVMGGDGEFDIPGIMISQDLGLQFQQELAAGGTVHVQFKTARTIDEPERIDTITGFSSKGPRTEDNLIKPEIAAPGQAIISAGVGTGNETVEMDGTSMAAPHMTGVMAVLKQKHPDFSPRELKALAMNTAKILSDANGEVPVSLQGAGRVQIVSALESPVVILPAGLSLGEVALENSQTKSAVLKVRNFSRADVHFTVETTSTPGLELQVAPHVTVPAGQTIDVPVTAIFTIANDAVSAAELDGRVIFKKGRKIVAQVPALAIRTLASEIRSPATRAGGFVALNNASPREGMALVFNLLGEDEAKAQPSQFEPWLGRSCDLQSVGYRIVRKTTEQGEKDVLQFAFKVYVPVTTWHLCEPVVLIDADGDGVAEQELGGVSAQGIEGLTNFDFASVLLDAPAARSIRAAFEAGLQHGEQATVDYTPAVLNISPMAPFNHSTLAVIEAPLELVARTASGMIRVQAAALYQYGDNVEGDDFLGADDSVWTEIQPVPFAQPYFGMDEFTTVPSGGTSLSIQQGSSRGKLILYYPLNGVSQTDPGTQYQILE